MNFMSWIPARARFTRLAGMTRLLPVLYFLPALFLFAPIIRAESKKPEAKQERRYKIGDLKDEPSPFDEKIRQPTKWEQFLTLTAAITVLWTGRIGEIHYRGEGGKVRIKKN